jgi:hypothetical protein
LDFAYPGVAPVLAGPEAIFHIDDQPAVVKVKHVADGIFDGAAVDLRCARRLIKSLGAAFDLQRIDSQCSQCVHVLNGAQVFRVHDVSAVFVLKSRHQFTRTGFFFQQNHGMHFIIRSCWTYIARTGFARFQRRVFPTAGVGARTLVGVAVRPVMIDISS